MIKDNFTISSMYKNNYLCVIFDTPMNITSQHNIITLDNYEIHSKSSSNWLKDAALSVYSYNEDYVTFKLKENFTSLFGTSNQLKCGYIFRDQIYYITTHLGAIQNMCTSTTISESEGLSISKGSAIAYKDDCISFTILDNIYFKTIIQSDFYIEKNDKKLLPSHIEKKSNDKIDFYFDESIFDVSNATVKLNTILNCSSTDILSFPIIGEDSISVINNIPNTLYKVSISSHCDNSLTLLAEFNLPLIRYDASDFEVVINDVSYPCVGSKSYTNEIMEMTVDGIYKYRFNKNTILLRSINNSMPYTMDNRNLPVIDLNGAYADYFLCTKGYLQYTLNSIFRNYIILNLEFDKDINSKDLETHYEGHLAFYSSINCFVLSIPLLGNLNIYGYNLDVPETDYTYEVFLSSVNNIVSLFINIKDFNFILRNTESIRYIDFQPDNKLKSIDDIFIFKSFECPILLERNEFMTCDTTDHGALWSLLGLEINKSVLLSVNHTNTSLFYGSISAVTIINGDLYILEDTVSSYSNNTTIDLINLKIKGNIYILTDDKFDITLEGCSCTNLLLYN